MFRSKPRYIKENSEYLNSILTDETMQSEKFRLALFGGITAFLFVWITIIIIIFYNDLTITFQTTTPLFFLLGILLFITFRQFNIRRIISKRIKERRPVSFNAQIINTIIEISIPSIMLVGGSFFYSSIEILSVPIVMVYLIIISLSILSLSPKLSLVAGIVGATQFIIIAILFMNIFEPISGQSILNGYYNYIGKFIMIGLSGVIAAFISAQLRKRIIHAHLISNERNKILNLFGQQISQEIVQELLIQKNELQSKKLFACVMFLDIRDYSSFAEHLEPEEIIKYQNDVFGFMIEKVTTNNGIINQFLGDGFMATFGAPIAKGNVCKNAVNASLEIIAELGKLNISGKIPETKIGIGLHAGYVVAGNVGTDIRKQYSISGNTVILASRIEQLTKKYLTSLLISHEVFDGLEEIKNNFISIGHVLVKGRTEPIEIFQINNNPQIEIEL